MSIQEFFTAWDGKYINFTDNPGNQCDDLFLQYNQNVVGCPVIYGNAIDIKNNYNKDFYEWIENTPTNVPVLGDVPIWNIGQYGHIAVFKEGDANQFSSFDQNWPLNSPCHFQQHDYNNVLGWLHPKTPTTSPDPLQECLKQHDALVGELDQLKAQDAKKDQDISQLKQTQDNLNQIINDRNNTITTLQGQISTLEQQVSALTTQRDLALDQAKQVVSLTAQVKQLEADKQQILQAQSTQNKQIGQLQNSSYKTTSLWDILIHKIQTLFRKK